MSEKTVNDEMSSNFPEKRDFEEELLALIRGGTPDERLADELDNYHECDIAAIIPELSHDERIRLYRLLGVVRVSEIFAYLDDVEVYLEEIGHEKAADVLENMDADDAMDVLEELEDDEKTEILGLMEEESAVDIRLIDSYDDGMIGSRMTTNFVSFPKDSTVKQAMKTVVSEAGENDNISTLYVTDEGGRFFGAIELSDLIRAREGTPLDDIISTSYPYFYANESVEDCIAQLKEYSEDSIPVLDSRNVLIGVITSNDIVEVVDEEMSDDYAKLAGLTETEDLDEPLLKSMKKRIPWLLALLGLGLLVSALITNFQAAVPAGLIIIYSFQSLILDMSGNTGTQSLGVTIRVLGDENLSGRKRLKFVLKELRVGLCNGLIIGTLAFTFVGLYLALLTDYAPAFGFQVSACIGISLVCAMMVASLDGTLIPMLFKKIGIDPAVASGPLITTVNDLIAVCTYYGLTLLLFVKIGLFSF